MSLERETWARVSGERAPARAGAQTGPFAGRRFLLKVPVASEEHPQWHLLVLLERTLSVSNLLLNHGGELVATSAPREAGPPDVQPMLIFVEGIEECWHCKRYSVEEEEAQWARTNTCWVRTSARRGAALPPAAHWLFRPAWGGGTPRVATPRALEAGVAPCGECAECTPGGAVLTWVVAWHGAGARLDAPDAADEWELLDGALAERGARAEPLWRAAVLAARGVAFRVLGRAALAVAASGAPLCALAGRARAQLRAPSLHRAEARTAVALSFGAWLEALEERPWDLLYDLRHLADVQVGLDAHRDLVEECIGDSPKGGGSGNPDGPLGEAPTESHSGTLGDTSGDSEHAALLWYLTLPACTQAVSLVLVSGDEARAGAGVRLGPRTAEARVFLQELANGDARVALRAAAAPLAPYSTEAGSVERPPQATTPKSGGVTGAAGTPKPGEPTPGGSPTGVEDTRHIPAGIAFSIGATQTLVGSQGYTQICAATCTTPAQTYAAILLSQIEEFNRVRACMRDEMGS